MFSASRASPRDYDNVPRQETSLFACARRVTAHCANSAVLVSPVGTAGIHALRLSGDLASFSLNPEAGLLRAGNVIGWTIHPTENSTGEYCVFIRALLPVIAKKRGNSPTAFSFNKDQPDAKYPGDLSAGYFRLRPHHAA
ncbi:MULTISPECIES: hypothetical protein [unclassified Pantoea]